MINRTENSMVPVLYRIQRVRKETYDTFTLEMESANGARPLAFSPGQFNMLYVYGVGEIPISICGDPDSPEILVHTTRAVGTVTHAMWNLQSGDVIGVRGPFGTIWPVDLAIGNDVIIVAGGIGLAPLRPALYRIISNRKKFGKVVLLYGTRSPADILYRKELENWRARLDLEVHVSVDRATGDWRGNVGVVTTLIPKASFDPLKTLAFICGPEIMMRYTILTLKERGVPTENMFVSMERNMKCGIGFCGHCQFGHTFICKDGPVFSFDQISELFGKREI